jgi:hypothetical protein
MAPTDTAHKTTCLAPNFEYKPINSGTSGWKRVSGLAIGQIKKSLAQCWALYGIALHHDTLRFGNRQSV